MKNRWVWVFSPHHGRLVPMTLRAAARYRTTGCTTPEQADSITTSQGGGSLDHTEHLKFPTDKHRAKAHWGDPAIRRGGVRELSL